jgi:hypothetical protein
MADVELNNIEGSSGLAGMIITATVFAIGYFFGKAVAQSECDEAQNRSRETDTYYDDGNVRYSKRRRHTHSIASSNTVCLIL